MTASRTRAAVMLLVLSLAPRALGACATAYRAARGDVDAGDDETSADASDSDGSSHNSDAGASWDGMGKVGEAASPSDAGDVLFADDFDGPERCSGWTNNVGVTFEATPNGHGGSPFFCRLCLDGAPSSVERTITVPAALPQRFLFSGWFRAPVGAPTSLSGNALTMRFNDAMTPARSLSLGTDWSLSTFSPDPKPTPEGAPDMVITIGGEPGTCFDVDDVTLSLEH